jgi:hypothetical protein
MRPHASSRLSASCLINALTGHQVELNVPAWTSALTLPDPTTAATAQQVASPTPHDATHEMVSRRD